MTLELLLLCSLIFIFIVSFCGLLQKIKQSYQRERIIADRMARRQTGRRDAQSDAYINSTFVEDFDTGSGIFPEAPPPYTQPDDPPKYEDIVKSEGNNVLVVPGGNLRQEVPIPHSTPPPPYTITT
ncbi:unnamed protein product [Phyllotreta striolata]|uniref:Uncharacterized protein n=1 Tax=Phyllotreta striolata TaxID=444603 RepID=A0A9N9XJE9_PHYSR|nr:unnamed protein product [Phyllotreta striolata]